MRHLRRFYLFFTKKRSFLRYQIQYLYLLIAFTVIAAGLTQSNAGILQTRQAGQGVVSLQFAKDVNRADQIITSWNFRAQIDQSETNCKTLDCPDYRPYALNSLIADYFFMFGYLLLLIYLIMQARRWFGDPAQKRREIDWGNFFAVVLSIFVILAVIADVIETTLSYQLIQTHIDQGSLTANEQGIVSSIFGFSLFKLVGLLAALLYIVISVLFKYSDELWEIVDIIRRYCLLSVVSILLLYFLFWGQAQGQDLLISLNEKPHQVVITLAFVFILAMISWISPRFFIVKYQLREEWKKKLEDVKMRSWFKEMWQFYVTDFSQNLKDCYYNTPDKGYQHKLFTNIPRLLGVLSILVVYGGFRNVLDITNTALFSNDGLSMESFLSPSMQVLAWMFIFGYFLYKDIGYERRTLITIITVILTLMVAFFLIDYFVFQRPNVNTLKGVHLLSLSTLGIACLFFIFVTYRRSIFSYRKIENKLANIRKKMMQIEETKQMVQKKESSAKSAYEDYKGVRSHQEVEAMVKMYDQDLKSIKSSKPKIKAIKRELSRSQTRLSILKMKASTFVLIGLGIALAFFIAINMFYPLFAPFFGTLAVVLIALAVYISFITFFLFIYGHNRNASVIAVSIPSLFLVLSFGIQSNNHFYDVELVDKTEGVERANLETYFKTWVAQRSDEILEDSTEYSVFLSASNGGGSRAAYWTTLLLTDLNDRTGGEFTRHLFSTSGASGGSVGSAVFTALSAYDVNNPNGRTSLKPKLEDIFNQDYLSATVASMMGRDLLQNAIPFDIRNIPNRSRNLGTQYENSIGKVTSEEQNYFAAPFADIWYGPNKQIKTDVPLYFGNTIQVEDGKRGIACAIDMVDSIFVDAVDVLKIENPNKTMKLSSASMLTNRFPFVNPVGRIPFEGGKQGHFADGGYFDNTGALTTFEVLREIKEIRDETMRNGGQDSLLMSRLKFYVLKIDNDEGTDAKGTVEQPAPNTPMSQLSAPALAVAQALLTGHVSYADDLLYQEVTENKDDCNYFHFWLPYSTIYKKTDCGNEPTGHCSECDDRLVQKIIPLGRYLSNSAREKIEEGLTEYETALGKIEQIITKENK